MKNIEENNDDVINFCKEHELGHIETSAKDSYKSVEAALLAVTSLALTQHRKKVRETVPKESINLNDMYKKTDKKGCMDCS